jgi:putative beta-lysine N-acetyltransferase
MSDRIERIGKSVCQHGPLNDRIYLMKLHRDDLPEIPRKLEEIACEEGYSKVFAKVPATYSSEFEQEGFQQEAVFLSRFFDDERRRPEHGDKVQNVLMLAEQRWGEHAPDGDLPPLPIEPAGPEDIEEMCELYREVFPTYPFPIHDPDYLRETMSGHIRYFCARDEGRVVAVASAELDLASQNAEMTDFATRPACRGRNIAVHLLHSMEEAVRREDVLTAYTIARALSPGMNITFSKLRYIFAGTLVNNTNISGQIESMNVWYKHLN